MTTHADMVLIPMPRPAMYRQGGVSKMDMGNCQMTRQLKFKITTLCYVGQPARGFV